MATYFRSCTQDEDFAKVCLFLFENRRALHSSFTTVDMITLLYSYVTEGRLIQAVDTSNGVVAAAAYYIGTPEQEFKNKDVALVDIVIIDQSYRGTRLFIQGLKYLVHQIQEEFPEAQEVRMVALSDNINICKLYEKLLVNSYERDGTIGKEKVFHNQVSYLGAILKKYTNV